MIKVYNLVLASSNIWSPDAFSRTYILSWEAIMPLRIHPFCLCGKERLKQINFDYGSFLLDSSFLKKERDKTTSAHL